MKQNPSEPELQIIPVKRIMDPQAAEAMRILIGALLAHMQEERAAKEAIDERHG